MIHIFRRHQRIIMLVVAILTIVAFIWLYNPANTKELGTNHVASIYGRGLTQADIDREVRNYGLALALGQIPLVSKLTGFARSQDEGILNFIWNIQILQHEAKILGIEPTQDQIGKKIQALPVFLTEGQFDPTKYTAFVQEQLGPRGFTESQVEKIIADALKLEMLEKLVASPATVSEAMVREGCRVYQKENFQAVRFDLQKIMSSVQVSQEELETLYRRERLVADETRSVEYVAFALPPESAGLTGKARIEAVQKLADSASRFAEQAAASSFAEAAKGAGLTPQTSPEFDRSGKVKTPPASPSGLDHVLPALAPAAFLLTESTPVSDPIQAQDEFYVAKLSAVTPARPLLFNEAAPLIRDAVVRMKAAGEIKEAANSAIVRLRNAVKAGQTFEQAAQAEGLTAEKFADVVPMDLPSDSPELPFAKPTLDMEPGDISNFIPDKQGGFAVFLESRAPLSDEEFAKVRKDIESEMLEATRGLLTATWLFAAREAADVTMGQKSQP